MEAQVKIGESYRCIKNLFKTKFGKNAFEEIGHYHSFKRGNLYKIHEIDEENDIIKIIDDGGFTIYLGEEYSIKTGTIPFKDYFTTIENYRNEAIKNVVDNAK